MSNILVACEESQRVCMAFRERGHEAYSCDIQEPSGGHPEWHILGDVLKLLNPYDTDPCGGTETTGILFETMDGAVHFVKKWDLIIAHPPCTRLCSSRQRWLHFGTEEYKAKKAIERQEGIDFFLKFTKADCERIAIENPVGIMSTIYRKPDCIYNPYDFKGETETKRTCLWLKNLPPLIPTQRLPKEQRTQGIWKAHFNGKYYAWNNKETAKLRSKTPVGVANAMAEQWSKILED